MSVNGIETYYADSTKSTQSRGKLAADFNAFLNLLTAQLKHQDPTAPMDSTQFTTQLVQFAQVEQQIQSNDNLEKLLQMQKANRMTSALGYIGARVTAESNYLPLQEGKGEFSYVLQSDAKETTVGVYDEKGRLVKSFTGATKAGVHEVKWDGTDNNGEPVEDGRYEVRVVAKNSDGKAVWTGVAVTGAVTGVSSIGDVVTLMMGKVGIPLDNILSFKSGSATT